SIRRAPTGGKMDFDNRNYETLDGAEASGLIRETGLASGGRDGGGQLIVPVILSGGTGSRLWPYSTEETPKQFLAITGSKSLFRLTLDRVGNPKCFKRPVIVGNIRHADLCRRELQAGEAAKLILEPLRETRRRRSQWPRLRYAEATAR